MQPLFRIHGPYLISWTESRQIGHPSAFSLGDVLVAASAVDLATTGVVLVATEEEAAEVEGRGGVSSSSTIMEELEDDSSSSDEFKGPSLMMLLAATLTSHLAAIRESRNSRRSLNS